MTVALAPSRVVRCVNPASWKLPVTRLLHFAIFAKFTWVLQEEETVGFVVGEEERAERFGGGVEGVRHGGEGCRGEEGGERNEKQSKNDPKN